MDVTTTLASLPFECHVAILACASIRDIGAAAAASRDWRIAATDDALWRHLLQLVWGVSGESWSSAAPARAHDEFVRRCRVHQLLGEASLSVRNSFVTAFPKGSNAQLGYAGVAADAEVDDTVGVSCSAQALEPWAFGPGDAVCYFEVDVRDGGEHQYVAVGWCRDDYPRTRKQPGWERHTYGYHGDDGRAYSGSGYGKRFGPAFGTGQTVGTGLVLPRASGGQGACIFYTLDGELVGSPFKRCGVSEMHAPQHPRRAPPLVIEPVCGRPLAGCRARSCCVRAWVCTRRARG